MAFLPLLGPDTHGGGYPRRQTEGPARDDLHSSVGRVSESSGLRGPSRHDARAGESARAVLTLAGLAEAWTPRSGRFPRARPSLLHSAPLLLLGALCLFPAAPAAAQGSDQTIWSATLTARSIASWVVIGGASVGCHNHTNAGVRASNCATAGLLSNRRFAHDGTTYTITQVTYQAGITSIKFRLNKVLPAALGAKLHISGGGTALEFALSGGQNSWAWNASSGVSGQTWSAGDEITLSITIPVTDPPGAPTGLGVTPGATQLALDWTAPSGSPTGYDVHYTSSTSVANDAAVGSAVATAWVAVSGSVTGTSHTITGLTNNTPYRVRVRASNGAGSGPWAFGTGTPKATVTGSTDATLRALVMTNNRSSRDTIAFTSSFSSTTYAYAADVPNARDRVRIVPTVNQANATVKVNGTGVTSAMESDVITLAIGANTITVEVTAQAGNTRNYTIAATRAVPAVSVERSSYAFAESGTAFVRLSSESTNVMSGTVTWAPGATHPVDLATDVGTLTTTFTATVRDVNPATFGIPITDDALNEEDETLTITLQPGTGYTVGSPATGTVTIRDNDPPAAPGSLSLTPGNTNLAASWQKPVGPVTKYQVRWKTTAAKDSAASTANDPTTGWVEGGEITASSTSQTITSLSNGTGYDVQVRANDGQTATGNGWGDWTATQSGTPRAKTYGFSPARSTVPPGTSTSFRAALTQAAPAGGLALTLTQLLGTSVPSGKCSGHTLAEAADIGSSPPTTVTVAPGETEARVNYPTADNGDDLVRGTECFALRLGTSVAGWTASADHSVAEVIIQRPSGKIAFGSDAAATAKQTIEVAENVAAGTVDVPVTVDWLPGESVTFAVEVVSTGTTATEGTDFSIATKSVTFGTTGSKTQNVTVTITDDVAVETDETIELKLSDGPGNAGTNDAYLRHAQGRLATVTIKSEDAVPGAVTGLGVAGSDTTLTVSWTAPSGTVTGYDVHYTSADTSAVANDAAVGSAVATAWVTAGAVTGSPHTIRPLTNETEYRVRVRATNASGSGPWAFGMGTPRAGPTYGFSLTGKNVFPGLSDNVEVTLSEGAPSGGLVLTVTQLLGTSVPTGVCTGAGVTLADAADIGSNPPTSVTVSQGQTTARVNFLPADNGDDLVRLNGGECFALQLGTSASGWLAGNAVLPVTIQRRNGSIAFGSSAASTAKHTATVAENVSGGTLSVPVTVDWLPAESTGFAVEVLSAGTATENTDFSIATKTLAFGPSTAKTMNVEVTITDDAAVETDETIELRLVAGSDLLSDVYGRHAQGSLAQITIRSEDALPDTVTGLSVRPGDTKMDVGWSAPSSAGSTAISGYDVHYTSATLANLANDAAVGTAVATEWVDAGHSGTATLSQQITGLTNNTAYRVRVRAVNGSGGGAWVVGAGTPSEAPAVTLAAAPNPVAEGSSVTVTATLSRSLGSDVTIPLTVTDGTAEETDHGTLASVTVTGGQTSASGTITTAQDADTDDETFTVALGTLPSSVVAGTPNSVEVTITDDDRATVTLEASPNPVDEGSSVTVTARLTKALRTAATIPLTVDPGTTEDGDIGELASVTVAAGRRSGTGTIETVRDEDEKDETFTVALGSALPSSVEAGDPSSVEITIRDDGPLRAELGLSAARPREGATVVLTATLNQPAPAGGVRVKFTADGAGDNPADPVADYTLDPEGVGARETEWIDIAEGDMRARARLHVVNDTEPEDDEAVAVGLVGSWMGAEYVERELTIPANDGGGGASAVAWIEAEPNPVDEGYDVTVTVRLSRALEEEATIPLTVRRGTSEEDDHGTLEGVDIAAGEDRASGTIATSEDADSDDETFTVRLGSLPAGVRAGTPSSVVVTIDDADKPDVWLEVEPRAVEEGDPFTVTAVLEEALARSVTIPVEVVRITSERGDHGSLSSIRIASGTTSGAGRITTSRDADGDDETFAVVLGEKLPSGVGRGHPDSVEVVIVDGGAPADAEVSLSAAPDPVPEGERVTVTATLTEALTRSVTIPVTVERGTSEQGDHGTLSSIRIASGATEGTGTITTSVDDDTEDETFTVKLRDNLPSGVAEGAVRSVEVTIADRGGAVPGRVRSLRVTPGNGTLALTWTAPSTGTVTAYEAWYKKRSESDWSIAYDDDYVDTSVEIAGLDNGTRYDVRVRGTNDHGAGPWATGSGTPAAGRANPDLRSLAVTASATRAGTYAAATLSPSFRPSVTAYTATAASGTNFVKVRPTAAASGSEILVDGAAVASGAESGPIAVSNGQLVWISVFAEGANTAKETSVEISIPIASGDVAGRSVTAAAAAALAVVGELGVADAAAALFGEKSLGEARLEALDRLGNANGRYDVGDLLSWIERCKSGGARCGNGPKTPPPASDAALPGAIGAAVKRPRRRPSGPRRPRRRRLRGLAVLLAVALWSCDGGGGPTAAIAPEPGTLAVEWTAQAGSPTVAGALVEIDGPGVGEVRAPGLELYESGEGTGPRRFVVAGALGDGPVIEFRVPDMRLAGLYTVRVVEVAGEDHRLLDAEDYRAEIVSN